MRTWNLAAVMKAMGHRDVKTALHYQHPELEEVRAALECGRSEKGYDTLYDTMPKNDNLGKSLTIPTIVLEKTIRFFTNNRPAVAAELRDVVRNSPNE